MEYVKCPSCGNETPGVLTRCKHCGEKLPKRQDTAPSEVYRVKTRSGFTTFYLWLGLVLNSIMGIAYFATIFTRKGLWTAYDPMYTRIYGFVSSAILFYGYLSLMRWKKSGFYILIAMAGVNQIMNLLAGGPVSLSTFFPIVSAIILYAVLQIRKDGKSCWDQLS